MQLLRAELERARALREEAKDPKAMSALDGVILALSWAIDDLSPPSQLAAAMKTDPLDHDRDGKRGGSAKGKLATASKRKAKR